MEIVQIY